MYTAMTIGISVYIAKMNRSQLHAALQAQAAREQKQMRDSINSLGDNMTPERDRETKKDEQEISGNLPSLFSDPGGDLSDGGSTGLPPESAAMIAEMAFAATNPGMTLPAMKVMAKVDVTDREKPKVDVEIDGVGAGGTTTSELTPAFAWEANGYAPLAAQLLGGKSGSIPAPDATPNDVLGLLLDLTGKNLATEDVLISGNLQRHPDSWQDHEAAALLLTALALREGPGSYSDSRTWLNRATAHLALAQALRGNQMATWPGLIAGAAIRTLPGRELDALAHLDQLDGQANVPAAALTWISALRMLAKADWRVAEVTEKSPLLLKIVWYQVLNVDLTHREAILRLEKVVPEPESDPSVPEEQQKQNPERLLTDWGRIGGNGKISGLMQADPRLPDYQIDLELHELDEISQAEGGGPIDAGNLGSVFPKSEVDTVSNDNAGKPVVGVIGLASFKNDARHHLLNSLPSKSLRPNEEVDPWRDPPMDSATEQNLFAKRDRLFEGVPGYELARLHSGFADPSELKPAYDRWIAEKKSWPVWEIPYQLANVMPGAGRVKAFYARAIPFGTVYQADYNHRLTVINEHKPRPDAFV